MNIEKINYFSRLVTWKDVWNITGDYFSGIKEKDSKWYQGFSQLSLEIGGKYEEGNMRREI